MSLKYITASVVLSLVFSCGTDSFELSMSNENWKEFNENVILLEDKVIQLPLDDKTGFWHYSMAVDQASDGDKLSFLNPLNNSLYVYDLDNSVLKSKTPFDKEGPNGTGSLNLAYHKFISPDSILVFNMWQGVLYLNNIEGEVSWKLPLIDRKIEGIIPNPEPSLSAPMILMNNKLYITCSIDRYEENYAGRKSVMTFDMSTKVIDYIIDYPAIYSQAYWGSVFKYVPSIDLGLDRNSLVVNFPVDPWIQKIDDEGEVLSIHYEVSSHIDKIDPLDPDVKTAVRVNHNVANQEKKEYSLTNSDFNKIISDPYNNLYYRVAYIRPTLEKLCSGTPTPDFSISILNKEFEKVGEKFFDGSVYRASMVFSGKGGLYIGRSDLYSKDEDTMSFSLMTLNRK
jgi:hypothetical protein